MNISKNTVGEMETSLYTCTDDFAALQAKVEHLSAELVKLYRVFLRIQQSPPKAQLSPVISRMLLTRAVSVFFGALCKMLLGGL